MKTVAEVVETSQSRWGAPRLADVLRRAIAGKRRTPEELAELERAWKSQEAQEKAAHLRGQGETWPDHLRRCGAPERAVEALRKPWPTPAYQNAQEFLASRKQNLILSGWTGVGKTAGACAVFGAAQRVETHTGHGFREWDSSQGLFILFPELLRIQAQLRFTRPAELPLEERDLLRDACRVRVLVLDEVGDRPEERLTTAEQRLLEELVNKRDRPGTLTVYTTNLSIQRNGDEPSDFGRFIGARALSRITRSYLAFDCGRTDLRTRGAQ